MFQPHIVRRTAAILLAFVLAAPAVSIAQQPPQLLPFPPGTRLDAPEIRNLHGLPDLAFGELLLYERTFAELPARVAFHLTDGWVFAVTFTFASAGLGPAALRRDADRVIKRLGVLYGPPVSMAGTQGVYKSHLWTTAVGTLEHTVVYITGVERHLIEVRVNEQR